MTDKGTDNYNRFINGDQTAFDDLIFDYKNGLILYINSIVRDIHYAEDIAIDTFVLFAVKKPKDKKNGLFKTWLYTVGRNLAIDFLRKNKKNNEVPLEEVAEVCSERDELLQTYIKKEQYKELYLAMEKIKTEYRQVIWLVYFENLSSKEASKIIKKSVNATDVLLHRAKKSLKEQLIKDGYEYEEL